ncbi:hypothetical protein HDV00_008797 [Rhizophlyctis rosea]|nr:hypothetical protein HDV00_008797 [Rhizophlyctis rosea]
MDPTANAALLEEIRTLTEHNALLAQENADLRRLQSARDSRAAEAHTGHLEELASKLQEDAGDLGAENARLRKMVEDMGKKLERELREHQEEKAAWAVTEKKLRDALTRERESVKDLKALSSRQEEELHTLSVSRPESPEHVTRERGDSGVKLQEEITELKIHVDNLTMMIETRDAQLARQTQEVNELHETIAALMDELEANYERVQFEGPIARSLVGASQAWSYSGDGASDGNTSDGASSPSDSPVLRAIPAPVPAVTDSRRKSTSPAIDLAPPSPPTEALLTPPKTPPPTTATHTRSKSKSKSPKKKNSANNVPQLSLPTTSLAETASTTSSRSPSSSPTSAQPGHKKTPSASFTTLADELAQMNETAPVYSAGTFTGEPGSLKSRLAAYGLNTEGNRKILKKRLQAYVKRRQAQVTGTRRA